jgi:peroxiredoxin
MDLSGDVLIADIKMKNGNFKFKLPPLQEPTFFKLSLNLNNFITLLGDTTEQIKVTAENSSFSRGYKVENSQGSSSVQFLGDKIMNLRGAIDSLTSLYNSLPESGKRERLESIGNEIITEIDDYKKSVGDFVLSNPRSFASYYALFLTLSDNSMVLNIWDRQERIYFAAIATSLNICYPESERVKQLYNLVLAIKAEERNAKRIEQLMSEATETVPEIKEKDINGNEIALSSLRGKVVLLSFHASWDEASTRENAFLKHIYSKYNPKGFEIYQVWLEQSQVVWESTLLQHEIPWISVSDLQFTDSYPARLYNVNRLPANYLISREGEITGKDLFGDMLEERLKQMLR